jgi:hypothetical protein
VKTYVNVRSYLARFFLKWETLQTKLEQIKIRILWSITFFRKPCLLWDDVEKIWYSHGSQYNTAHACFMLHNKSYRHTIRICNTSLPSPPPPPPPPQLWENDLAVILRYIYFACLAGWIHLVQKRVFWKALARLRTQLHKLIVALSDHCNLIQNWPAAASSRS